MSQFENKEDRTGFDPVAELSEKFDPKFENCGVSLRIAELFDPGSQMSDVLRTTFQSIEGDDQAILALDSVLDKVANELNCRGRITFPIRTDLLDARLSVSCFTSGPMDRSKNRNFSLNGNEEVKRFDEVYPSGQSTHGVHVGPGTNIDFTAVITRLDELSKIDAEYEQRIKMPERSSSFSGDCFELQLEPRLQGTQALQQKDEYELTQLKDLQSERASYLAEFDDILRSLHQLSPEELLSCVRQQATKEGREEIQKILDNIQPTAEVLSIFRKLPGPDEVDASFGETKAARERVESLWQEQVPLGEFRKDFVITVSNIARALQKNIFPSVPRRLRSIEEGEEIHTFVSRRITNLLAQAVAFGIREAETRLG
ncbi:MAG: hypothetical protein KDD55_00180 [Bdellovibrionales bacterium]|nr:hypothetical protein [Bdellovibrionales bacterium]